MYPSIDKKTIIKVLDLAIAKAESEQDQQAQSSAASHLRSTHHPLSTRSPVHRQAFTGSLRQAPDLPSNHQDHLSPSTSHSLLAHRNPRRLPLVRCPIITVSPPRLPGVHAHSERARCMKVIFFPNGNVAVFKDGKQVPILQESWLLLYVLMIAAIGVRPNRNRVHHAGHKQSKDRVPLWTPHSPLCPTIPPSRRLPRVRPARRRSQSTKRQHPTIRCTAMC